MRKKEEGTKYLTVAQVAREMGLNYKTVLKYCHESKLPAMRIGPSILIDRNYFEHCKMKPKQPILSP